MPVSSSKWLADSIPTFRRLAKAVDDGYTFPVVLLGGTEEYLLTEAKDLVCRHLLREASADFDYFEAEAAALDSKDLNSQLSSLPMFGKRRVVVLVDPDGMRRQRESADNEAKQQLLKRYVASPSPTSSLILIQPLERKPGKFELERLQADANGYWFFELRSDELAKFVRNFVASAGKSIAGSAVEYLIENSLAQLRDLKAKLEHLILFAGEASEITPEMAMKVTGVTAEVEIFAFEDALLEGNASRVLADARELMDKGMAPLELLGRLRLLTQKVWLCGGMAARKLPDDDFKRLLGGQVFKKNSFIHASRRIGDAQMQELMLNLLQIELHLKSKSSDVRSLILEWLWNACSQKSSGTLGTKVNQQEFVK